MEGYKEYLYYYIASVNTIEDVERVITNNPSYTINRNEEGNIHSHYLVDRYEPAIIHNCSRSYVDNYYLFDGDIKDCKHPFCISYEDGNIKQVRYYSSERIINGLPIYMGHYLGCEYNQFQNIKILDEYASKCDNTNRLEDFTELCDEM